MLTIQSDHNTRMILESDPAEVWIVAFHPDGKHFFDGTRHEIRRWRVADGQELRKQTDSETTYAISVSKDERWLVCGTTSGASVWDAELREKVITVESGKHVFSVDVAPDCTKFATGTTGHKATIWSITTGRKLIGPLEHGGDVNGVKFSPDGGRLATACYGDPTIRIFDAHNGDQLITIENPIPINSFLPIVWSTHGQRLFAVSEDYKIKSFDSPTGSPLAEWQIHGNSDGPMSVALSANGKFIASSAGCCVSFWDTSTLAQLGIVEDSNGIHCIALSPDDCRLATGSIDSGKTIIWDLSSILPGSYLSYNVSTALLKSTMTFIHKPLFLYARKLLAPDRKWSHFESITVQ